jgi:hypothetical protein
MPSGCSSASCRNARLPRRASARPVAPAGQHMFVTRGMQWHPSESLGRNKNTELRPVARTASTACVPAGCPDCVPHRRRARRWRHRCAGGPQIFQGLSNPLSSMPTKRRLPFNGESARHRSNSPSTMTPRPRSVRRLMRCITDGRMQRIISSTRCRVPTPGSITDGQSTRAGLRQRHTCYESGWAGRAAE